MLRAAIAVAVVASGCSYSTSFRDCEVACTTASPACPDGFTCGTEGYCRASGASATCDAVRDARPPDDAPPSGTRYCAGAPAQCETLVDNPTCVAQTGCTWTATTCSFTENCANHLPNTDCDGTPGCMTHVTQPYCRAIASYCQGPTTKPTCEARTNCSFFGGCAGVARPCGQLANETACEAQAGCDWK